MMPRNKIIYYFGFPLVGLLFFSFTVLCLSDGVTSRENYWKIQLEWFARVNQFLLPQRTFFENITQLGDALILMPIISFLIIWKPQVWAGFFGVIPLGAFLSIGGKYWAAMPRPGAVLDPAIYTAVGGLNNYNSLPSGHTLSIFAMMTVFILVLIPTPQNKIHLSLWGLGMLVAAFIGISRVAVGVHWPLDIVAGAALGYLAGVSGVILTQRYSRWWRWLEAKEYQFVFGIIILAWSFGLFKRVIRHSDNTDIIIWISATMGLLTALCLLMKSARYFYKATRLDISDDSPPFKSIYSSKSVR